MDFTLIGIRIKFLPDLKANIYIAILVHITKQCIVSAQILIKDNSLFEKSPFTIQIFPQKTHGGAS